jgi:hypothetical protein
MVKLDQATGEVKTLRKRRIAIRAGEQLYMENEGTDQGGLLLPEDVCAAVRELCATAGLGANECTIKNIIEKLSAYDVKMRSLQSYGSATGTRSETGFQIKWKQLNIYVHSSRELQMQAAINTPPTRFTVSFGANSEPRSGAPY